MANVTVKNTKKYGRGLYAVRNFKKGEIIEIAPVVVIDKMDADTIETTMLNLYVFEWNKNSSALALGNGSLFNHSNKSNVSYMNSFRTKEIVFMTTRKIKKGEQLFIDYGYDPKEGIKITQRNKERKLTMFKNMNRDKIGHDDDKKPKFLMEADSEGMARNDFAALRKT